MTSARNMLDDAERSLPDRKAISTTSNNVAWTLAWVTLLLTFSSTSAFCASCSASSTTLCLRGQTDCYDESSSKKMSSIKSGNDQDKVDEYLEFLEKRYRRLHDDSSTASDNHFSVLTWLRGGDAGNDSGTTAIEQQENALFVLGVSELASKRLLQNLHINIHDEKKTAAKRWKVNEGNIIDVSFAASSPLIIQIGSLIVSRIMSARSSFITFQNQNQLSDRATRVASSKAVTLGSVTSAIYTGGKRSIAATLSVITTIMLLSAPLIHSVMRAFVFGQNRS